MIFIYTSERCNVTVLLMLNLIQKCVSIHFGFAFMHDLENRLQDLLDVKRVIKRDKVRYLINVKELLRATRLKSDPLTLTD